MTRDEMRAVCFLAMARARYKKRYGEDWNEAAFWLQVPHIAEMTAAFDALHDIAFVTDGVTGILLTNPPEKKL